MEVLAMDAEHVEADAEVAEPRLEARAMGAMGCVVKLDHLAEEAEADAAARSGARPGNGAPTGRRPSRSRR